MVAHAASSSRTRPIGRSCARVKAAVAIPVVVNGDIRTAAGCGRGRAKSGADGVMIGRGAYGAPWLPAQAAAFIETGIDPGPPPLSQQGEIAVAHVDAMLAHYGALLGLKNARKHVGWYLETSGAAPTVVKAHRRDPVHRGRSCAPARGTCALLLDRFRRAGGQPHERRQHARAASAAPAHHDAPPSSTRAGRRVAASDPRARRRRAGHLRQRRLPRRSFNRAKRC